MSDDDAQAGAGPEPRPIAIPEPAERARRGASGVPMAAAGRSWLLIQAGLLPGLDRLRDKFFDDMVLRESVDWDDLYDAAFVLLRANYRLTGLEAGAILAAAEPAAVRDATLAAVMGGFAAGRGGPRTFSRWARASLKAAGLDPATLAADEMHDVLDILVATGRTVPAAAFVESAAAMEAFNSFGGMAGG